MLDVVDTGSHPAQWNMDWDAEHLAGLDPDGPSLLHFYEWERSSISYGHFLDPKKFFNMGQVEEEGIDLARRPTGGGITFHLWDFAFSFFVGASSPFFSQDPYCNYQRVNRALLSVVRGFFNEIATLHPVEQTPQEEKVKNFCMAHATKYDLIINEKKVAGAAQRKTQKGFLHQGTVFLIPPDLLLLQRILLPEAHLLLQNQKSMHSLLTNGADVGLVKSKIKKLLFTELQKNLQSLAISPIL